jgi:ketosteroid isomerase-like protein
MSLEDLQTQVAALREQLQPLLDRQAIRDCLAAYCRGIDRMDKALIMSAYHPDAVDDHLFIVDGPEPFADWANDLHTRGMRSHQHIITTHNCDLDGDVAHAETYWMSAAHAKDSGELTLSGGRYIDRFEKRDGEWKIAARKVLFDWSGAPVVRQTPAAVVVAVEAFGRGSRDKSDPSYQRPLIIDPSRIGPLLDYS